MRSSSFHDAAHTSGLAGARAAGEQEHARLRRQRYGPALLFGVYDALRRWISSRIAGTLGARSAAAAARASRRRLTSVSVSYIRAV